MLSPWKKSCDQPRQHIRKQRHYFANKGPSSQGYGFSSSHVWMWELDYKESWGLRNQCFRTVVLEKTWESLWTARWSNQSILKGISFEYSLEGLMLKLKLQYFDHVMWRTKSFEKTLMMKRFKVGAKGMTEDEMIGWHHWLNGHEFEKIPGAGDRQWGLVCCSPWVEKSWTQLSDWTELNWWY